MGVSPANVSPLILGLLVFATFSGGGSTVSATSCAPPEDGSARSIVTGVERLWGEQTFFELYDFAISGTVVSIETDETPGSETYGDTEVKVEVINAFGVDDIDETVVVSEDDPGWINGYEFRVGGTYFIPLVTEGPQGTPNYSFLCDPISRISESEASELAVIAIDQIAVATPEPSPTATLTPSSTDEPPVTTASSAVHSSEQEPPPSGSEEAVIVGAEIDEPADGSGSRTGLLAAGFVAIIIVAAGVLLVRRQRSDQTSHTQAAASGST